MKSYFDLQQYPYPTQEYRDKQATALAKTHLTDSTPKHRLRAKHIELIKIFFPTARKILCIGARSVSETNQFIDSGYDCIGIDFSTAGSIKNIDAHYIDNHFQEKEFDLVYANNSLEHMYNFKIVLSQIRYVSKHGLFATLPIYLNNVHVDANHCSYPDLLINRNWKLTLDQVKNDSWLNQDFEGLDAYEIIHYDYRANIMKYHFLRALWRSGAFLTKPSFKGELDVVFHFKPI